METQRCNLCDGEVIISTNEDAGQVDDQSMAWVPAGGYPEIGQSVEPEVWREEAGRVLAMVGAGEGSGLVLGTSEHVVAFAGEVTDM